MANKKIWLVLWVLVLTLGLVLAGCDTGTATTGSGSSSSGGGGGSSNDDDWGSGSGSGGGSGSSNDDDWGGGSSSSDDPAKWSTSYAYDLGKSIGYQKSSYRNTNSAAKMAALRAAMAGYAFERGSTAVQQSFQDGFNMGWSIKAAGKTL